MIFSFFFFVFHKYITAKRYKVEITDLGTYVTNYSFLSCHKLTIKMRSDVDLAVYLIILLEFLLFLRADTLYCYHQFYLYTFISFLYVPDETKEEDKLG